MAARKRTTTPVKQATTLFESSENTPIYPVNGGFGAINPSGDAILLTLFTEMRPVPTSGIIDFVGGKATPSDERFDIPDVFIVRRPQCTLHLNAMSARAIATWLNEQADKLEAHNNKG